MAEGRYCITFLKSRPSLNSYLCQVKGFLSVDDCGRSCVGTRGCTAFHAAPVPTSPGQDKLECFLFGHKSVIPAAGLAGNCYTVSKGAAECFGIIWIIPTKFVMQVQLEV